MYLLCYEVMELWSCEVVTLLRCGVVKCCSCGIVELWRYVVVNCYIG